MLNSIEDYFKEYMPGEEMPLPDGWDGNIVTAISDGKHNIIPVPKDFYYVGGNLGNGVIISDNPADKYDGTVDKTTWEYTTSLQGNQFVWIPCTEAEYHKTTNWAGTGQPAWGVYDPTEADATEKERVLKYGGFYVARYEAGLADGITPYSNDYWGWGSSPGYNITGIPKSKAGQDPWIFISQTNSKANAESWYASSSSVESGLITGTQWDVMLNKFIGTTNQNGVTFTENDLRYSNRWGNYYNTNIPYTGRTAIASTRADGNFKITPFTRTVATGTTGASQATEYTTGASKVAESYHIYDVGGNIYEWTEEIGGPQGGSVNDLYRVYRGGCCETLDFPTACVRFGNDPASSLQWRIGFRAVLYIK